MGLYTQELTLEAYIRNSLSVSKYGGIIHRGTYIGGGWLIYVYGNCLIAMGIEWFEPDVFGLASKAFVHLSACRVSEI
jgi:hypothetical protein